MTLKENNPRMKSELASLPGYDVIDDITIQLHAELDHKTVSFEQLVNLTVGSVLQLGRPTGENVDLYAEDVLLGSGEILIVDSTLAVRIADLRDKPSVLLAEPSPPLELGP
jgi:flagellar motor switch/type III secretory pathway protein FliN